MRLTGIAILTITAALGVAGCNQSAGPEVAPAEAPAVGDTAAPVEAAPDAVPPAEVAPEAVPAPEGEAPGGALIPDNE